MSDIQPPEPASGTGRKSPSWLRALLVIAGIILVILSFLVWGYPLIAGLSYVYIFGFALIVLGASRMGQGIFEEIQPGPTRIILVIFGILLFAIGLYALAFPFGGGLTLIFFFAFALIIAGADRLFLVWSGWPGPGYPPYLKYLVAIAGILAVLLGIVSLVYPAFGATFLFVIISIGILILGIELIVAGITGKKVPGS